MLHLALVNNILAAIGASPHLWRPEFPVQPGRFPAGVVLRLSPFTEATIDHFIYIERPEGITLVDGAGFDHPEHYLRPTRPDLLSPTPQDYASQGQLYHTVLRGLGNLVDELGEKNVFVGHGEAQVAQASSAYPVYSRWTAWRPHAAQWRKSSTRARALQRTAKARTISASSRSKKNLCC